MRITKITTWVAALLLLGGSAVAAPKGEKLRVIQFDVRQQLASDRGTTTWFNRREAIDEMVRAESPDILLMQRLTVPQAEDMKNLLGRHELYYRHGQDKTEGLSGYGTAIAWRADKYEAVDRGCFWLSDTPDTLSRGWGSSIRSSVWVRLRSKASGKELLCMSVHLDPGTTELAANSREKSIGVVSARAKALAGEDTPLLIGGGFQVESSNRIIVPLREWLRDAREDAGVTDDAGTFNAYQSRPSASKPDFILYRGAKPLQYMVLNGKYGTVARFISDHYPVLVNFRL